MKDLKIFIQDLFQRAISHPLTIGNIQDFEHICLKYISFLTKHLDNPLLSYYELKKILGKKKGLSIYFEDLSNIYSKSLKKLIELIHNLSEES